MHFSQYDFRIRDTEGQTRIFDIIRKKYVVLTPEEWVRQHIIHYLVHDHAYPKSLISVEKQLKVNTLIRRTDIVLYAHNGKPVLIVECKAPDIQLTQSTLDQAARYNITLQVPFLWISNGSRHVLCRTDHINAQWSVLETLPPTPQLITSVTD